MVYALGGGVDDVRDLAAQVELGAFEGWHYECDFVANVCMCGVWWVVVLLVVLCLCYVYANIYNFWNLNSLCIVLL